MRVHAPRGRQPADSCIYPGATRNLFRRPAHASRILTNCRSSSRTNTESKQTLDELRGALQEAIRAEDYVVAAELRDIIRQKEKEDPLVKLQEELRTAIADERYGDAALLRDQMKELQPPPPPPVDCPPSTSSSKITEGIRVEVQSYFVPFQSQPENSAFLFAYRVRITNESHPTTVKLVSRRWIITDGRGRTQEVQGQGVVGHQPELPPGATFEYESACPLRTPNGSMKGEYEMYSRVSQSNQWTTSFLVNVGEFALAVDGPRAT